MNQWLFQFNKTSRNQRLKRHAWSLIRDTGGICATATHISPAFFQNKAPKADGVIESRERVKAGQGWLMKNREVNIFCQFRKIGISLASINPLVTQHQPEWQLSSVLPVSRAMIYGLEREPTKMSAYVLALKKALILIKRGWAMQAFIGDGFLILALWLLYWGKILTCGYWYGCTEWFLGKPTGQCIDKGSYKIRQHCENQIPSLCYISFISILSQRASRWQHGHVDRAKSSTQEFHFLISHNFWANNCFCGFSHDL